MASPPTPHLGILSAADLASAGVSRRRRETALAAGTLIRVRTNWYATPQAHPDAVAAVRIGGVLTATSASRHHGMWTVDDPKLHVLVARNASRLRLEGGSVSGGGVSGGSVSDGRVSGGRAVCIHWAQGQGAPGHAVADPLQVVRDTAHCLPLEVAVALADSALNQGVFSIEQLESAVPKVALRCDGASQSGTESLTRMRLRSRRLRVRSQVHVRGVGFVDLLVGDRLVIECDSEGFHDGYHSERDYDRDMALIAQGYIVLRLQYRHVMFGWSHVEAIVLEIVRAGRHRWPRNGGAGTVVAL